MTDLEVVSRVKELQAILFPVRPIPGGELASFQRLQELQLLQLGRYEAQHRHREAEFPRFSAPFGVRDDRLAKESLRTALDARCAIDGIAREAARWPTECQVLPARVRHVEQPPTVPEPFYLPTGKEPRPKPLSDEFGTVVFRYYPTSVANYFSRSCVGGSTVLPFSEFPDDRRVVDTDAGAGDGLFLLTETAETPENSSDLRFESRFESGNLCKVVKITDTYYQLYLRKDLYTQRHTQWYYFRISNTRSRTTYRLSIVNLSKEESLYNEGLRPLLYSTEDAKQKAVGWRRCGDNIAYYRNDSSSDEEKEKHTLTFNVSFPHDRDTVYLAHCYPYTYTDLQEYLAKLVADPAKTRFTKLRLLCRTLAGNGVYYLTITAPAYDEEVRRKRGIVITARVHPGETPSSWTMKGIIDFLTGESNQAKALRERFVFKLVPMLNPDGVIVGNNRCSLSGKDLNRQYRTVMRESYPSVWHTKLMIRRLLEECGVAIYCDLHGHSRKHNVFAYGCESKRAGPQIRLSEQVFPLMLHKNAADKFSFESCKFHMEKGKEGTGRVVVWSMGVQNSYTMEASMGGSTIGSRSGTHFSTQDYEQIGKAFCETLLDFFDQDPVKREGSIPVPRSPRNRFATNPKERLRSKIIGRLTKEGSSAEDPTNIDLTDYSSDEGDASIGSDSEKGDFDSTEGSWDGEETQIGSSRNLYAPPPTPAAYLPPRSFELAKRRSRKGIATSRSFFQRKMLLTKRAVMDLPTTDPGSDLCDLSDSADEGASVSTRICKSGHAAAARDADASERRRQTSSDELVLPEIAKRCNVSLDERFVANKEKRKTKRRPPCLRLVRASRHRSPAPLKNQDIRIKLSSLRQRIWMGVPSSEDETAGKRPGRAFPAGPLSWGVSSMALARNRIDSDALLESCTKRLESLEYAHREDDENRLESRLERRLERRPERRSGRDRERPSRTLGTTRDASPEAEEQQRRVAERKPRKKKSRLKWQKIVNLSSRVKETRHGKTTSFLTINADSLKLVTVEMPAKPQPRPHRVETKRIHRKNAASNAAKTPSVAKPKPKPKPHASRIRLQPLIAPLCDSLSSDESTDSRGQKASKKKQKKKKTPSKKNKSTSTAGSKKRVGSANLLRDS